MSNINDPRRIKECGEVTAILLSDNLTVRLSNGPGYTYDVDRYITPDTLVDVMGETFGFDDSELHDAHGCLEMIHFECATWDLVP